MAAKVDFAYGLFEKQVAVDSIFQVRLPSSSAGPSGAYMGSKRLWVQLLRSGCQV